MRKKGKIINIGTKKLDEIIDEVSDSSCLNRYYIYDLRDSYEYYSSHIKGAENIDGEELRNIVLAENEYVILYCDSGTNSMHYAKILASKGNVIYNLLNGLENYRGKYLIGANSKIYYIKH